MSRDMIEGRFNTFTASILSEFQYSQSCSFLLGLYFLQFHPNLAVLHVINLWTWVSVCPVETSQSSLFKACKDPPPTALPQGASDAVTVQTYRVKYEPFLEQIPSSGLTAETEKEEQFLLPCVFSDPTAPQQEFWRKKAFSNKGNENLASWPGEQSECCEKLGVTGNQGWLNNLQLQTNLEVRRSDKNFKFRFLLKYRPVLW